MGLTASSFGVDENEQQESSFNGLSEELLLFLFSWLDLQDIGQVVFMTCDVLCAFVTLYYSCLVLVKYAIGFRKMVHWSEHCVSTAPTTVKYQKN